ncbi:MAG: hypothetical protein WCA98_15515 [Candidatus Acidiferrales bacterium]
MRIGRTIRIAGVLSILILGATFAVAPSASAQGCAMCYQTASAAAPQAREALRNGILILLFPPLGMFVGIFSFLYRRRNLSRTSELSGTRFASMI